MCLLLLQATVYYVQSREEMFEQAKPWVIIINMVSLVWFICLQYFRFKDTGRACSGDFIYGNFGNPFKKQSATWPREREDQIRNLVIDQGFWFLVFIIAQYVLYILCKISSIMITNKLEAEYEEERAKLGGLNH